MIDFVNMLIPFILAVAYLRIIWRVKLAMKLAEAPPVDPFKCGRCGHSDSRKGRYCPRCGHDVIYRRGQLERPLSDLIDWAQMREDAAALQSMRPAQQKLQQQMAADALQQRMERALAENDRSNITGMLGLGQIGMPMWTTTTIKTKERRG